MTQFDLFEGRKRRDEGIDRAAQVRQSNLKFAQKIAKDYSLQKGSVTADDVQHTMSCCGIDLGNAAGAIFRGPGWTKVGYKQSERASNHARVIAVWRWDGEPLPTLDRVSEAAAEYARAEKDYLLRAEAAAHAQMAKFR